MHHFNVGPGSRSFKKRKEYLQKIHNKLSEKDIPLYLRTEQLVSHGLDAKVVPVMDNVVQFEPSFFKPQDENIQTRFPIDTEYEYYNPQELHDPPPDWDEELKFALTCVQSHPGDLSPAEGQEKAFKSARWMYELKLKMWKEDQARPPYEHHGSGRVSGYIRHLKWVTRKDMPYSLRKYVQFRDDEDPNDPHNHGLLRDLTPLAGERIITNPNYPHDLSHPNMKWHIRDEDEDWRNDPVPHAILSFEGRFDASYHRHCLTSYELIAIVRFLLNRCHWKSWRFDDCSHHLTQPVLLISYVGRMHGRITQAHYDEAGLHLQYTRLMSFEVNAKLPPPVELFLRYAVSLPAGIERSKSLKSSDLLQFLKSL